MLDGSRPPGEILRAALDALAAGRTDGEILTLKRPDPVPEINLPLEELRDRPYASTAIYDPKRPRRS